MNKILLSAALLLLPLAARAESELSLTLQGGAVKYDQALAAPSDLGAEYGVRLTCCRATSCRTSSAASA